VAWAVWTTKLCPSTERRKARDLFRAFPVPSNNVRRLLLQSVKFQKRPPLASAVLKSQRSSDAELRGLESNYRSHPSFLSQSKLSQTLGLFTSGETLKFMFHRRLPSVLRALLLFDAFFGSCRARFEFTVNVSCAEIIPQNLPEAGELVPMRKVYEQSRIASPDAATIALDPTHLLPRLFNRIGHEPPR
jgi:hypothetical protein